MTDRKLLSLVAAFLLIGSTFLLLAPGQSSNATTTSKVGVSCTPKSGAAKADVITCTAKVKGSSPTGNVTWSQTGGTGEVVFSLTKIPPPLNRTMPACFLSSGSCSILVVGIKAGTITIQAVYGGDANNKGSIGVGHIKITGALDDFNYLVPCSIYPSTCDHPTTYSMQAWGGPTVPGIGPYPQDRFFYLWFVNLPGARVYWTLYSWTTVIAFGPPYYVGWQDPGPCPWAVECPQIDSYMFYVPATIANGTPFTLVFTWGTQKVVFSGTVTYTPPTGPH